MHLPILHTKHLSRLKSKIRDTLFVDPETQIQLIKSTAWADGLRGLATIGVVASHMTLCFARSLLTPCCSNDDATPKLFQLPILRLLASGHSWVAIFFLLMGFVNSLKPLKLAQSNRHDEALVNLANSSMRRIFRLVLPATLTTLIAWFLCQLRLMERARYSDAWWLYTATPVPSSTVLWAISDLFTALRYTWLYHNGDNIYNQPQWTMMPLLQGSLMLLLALLFTINLTPMYRNFVLAIAAVWSINLSGELNDPLVGLTTISGILLANICIHPTFLPTLIHKRITPIISLTFATLGLLLMSSPSSNPENSLWSSHLHNLAQHLPYPTRIQSFRFLGSLGAILFLSGLLISPLARNILSTQPLAHLGRISFPVFLLHPIFMQTIMPLFAFTNTWEEFKVDPPVLDDNGAVKVVMRHPQRGVPMIWVGIVVSMGCCLVAAQYWVIHVEPVFGRIAGWCERVMMGRGDLDGQRAGGGRTQTVLPVVWGSTDEVQKMNGGAGDGIGMLTPPQERSMSPASFPLLDASRFDHETGMTQIV